MIEMKEFNLQPYEPSHSFSYESKADAEQSKDVVSVGKKMEDRNSRLLGASEPIDPSLSEAWVNMVTEIQKAGSKSSSHSNEPFAAVNNMYITALDNSGNINLQRGIVRVLNQEAQNIREEREREELENSKEK